VQRQEYLSIKADLKLKDRVYACGCGKRMDGGIYKPPSTLRDALNIKLPHTVIQHGKLRLWNAVPNCSSLGQAGRIETGKP
jgi:hypothetical protein